MATALKNKGKIRLTISVSPEVYNRVFVDKNVNRSQLIESALEEFSRNELKRKVTEFCCMKDESDLVDAESVLSAQMETLDHE
jgi:hypothetical protein